MSEAPHEPRPQATVWRRAVPGLVTVALVGLIAAYLYDERSRWLAHFAVRPGLLAAMALLVVVTLALRALANQQLFARLGVAAPYADWFGVVSVNAFSNYLPLSAGLFAKAVYLKRVHAMSYGAFAVGQVGLLVLVVGANGALALAALAWWPAESTVWIAAGFACMLAVGALPWLPAAVTRRIAARWPSWNESALDGVRRAAAPVIAIQMGVLLATGATLQLGFAMGAANAGLPACIVFSAATVLTRLVSITPGALGLREALIGGLAVLTGFELRDALVASAIARVAEMAVIFVLGAAFTYRLSGRVVSTYESEGDDARSLDP